MNSCRLVSYYRVSTAKQGQSGLGLEAQEAAVAAHVASSGCNLIAAYTEIESGRKSERPQLIRAIAHAKRAKATLVIAKLDRLSRNVHFVSGLMESGVDFIACDNPTANRLTIHILAAVAEEEARAISARTKAALAAYKARGGRLGASLKRCRNLTHAARQRGAIAGGNASRKAAAERYADVAPAIHDLRGAGLSLRSIADRLTAEGTLTHSGRPWNAMQVRYVLRAA